MNLSRLLSSDWSRGKMEIVANFHEHDKHNAFMLILVTRVGQFRHFLLIQQVSMVFISDHPCIEGIKCTLNTWVA